MSGFLQAIISDLHGNLEATNTVFADIERCGASEIFCLGDLIGDGPDPVDVVKLVRNRADVVLQGECDWNAAVGWELENAFGLGRSSSRYRRLLGNDAEAVALVEFLGSCLPSLTIGSIMYVHGSPRYPRNEYLFPEDTYNQKKMAAVADCFETLCFAGHTHVPGIFVHSDRGPGEFDFLSPADFSSQYRLGNQRVICNVGSVGQPRDGDPRACYVLFDGETITFRRVDYDQERTIAKIDGGGDSGGYFGARLRDGR